MNTLRLTVELAAKTVRMFYHHPADMLALVWHHWTGNDKAAQAAYERMQP